VLLRQELHGLPAYGQLAGQALLAVAHDDVLLGVEALVAYPRPLRPQYFVTRTDVA
jgi:hypothetical protein